MMILVIQTLQKANGHSSSLQGSVSLHFKGAQSVLQVRKGM